jgi:tetratricopeptide (TPR) repeat protein
VKIDIALRWLKDSLCVSAVIGLLQVGPVLTLGLGTLMFFGESTLEVQAQTARERRDERAARARGEEPKQATEAMSEEVYKKLGEAQKQVEELNDFEKGLSILDKLNKKKRLNNTEQVQVWSLYAFIYYSMEDYPKAIEAYETTLSVENVPDAVRKNVLFSLSQLNFQQENWQKGIDALLEWLKTAENVGPYPYVSLSQAYYQLKEYQKAIPPIHKAMEIAKEMGKPLEENWFLLLRVYYYELKDTPKVIETIETLVKKFPKKDYWVQLAGMYGEQEQEKKQLSTLEVAYMQGYLDKERELLNLGLLLLQAEVPYKGAKIIEKGLADGVIKSTEKNWNILSQAWSLAQEDRKAIPPLKKVAELSATGEPYIRLAQIYADLGEWENAVDAVKKGVEKGKLERPDHANLLLGQAYFSLDRLDEAEEVFILTAADQRSGQVAQRWITYIGSEKTRRADLEKALR